MTYINCTVTVIASLLPFTLRQEPLHPDIRTTTLLLGFGVCFVILSISFEGLFFLMFCGTLYMWTHVEAALHTSRSGLCDSYKLSKNGRGEYQVHTDDIRIAVFFLFFVQLAFFGTGK